MKTNFKMAQGMTPLEIFQARMSNPNLTEKQKFKIKVRFVNRQKVSARKHEKEDLLSELRL